ncbi:MAG: TIR domain-containing protein [Anaerolineae bacterium]|nr:TIR domain-containing protein [Anaerolineae bacterium]
MSEKINQQSTNELFISYSRRDNTFVQNLIGDLRTRGIDPWFDQEDIDKGRKWWEEIKQGIIRANAFVFVISPDSLRSQVCNWELAFARQHNKRIIPFLIDDRVFGEDVQTGIGDASWRNPEGQQIRASENWSSLQSINFISSKECNTCVDQIIATARADFDHVDAHRRFLVRAHEWEIKGRKAAFVLSGGDLKEAQEWLVTSWDKIPQPLTLHREYVAASQLHAKKQRRRIAVAAVTAILIVAIASLFGLRQSQLAEERDIQRATQQAIAEKESSVALSRELATKALSISSDPTQYDLALLLSTEAYLRSPTYEAYNSLFSLLQQENHPTGFIHYSPGSEIELLPGWNIMETASPQDSTIKDRILASLEEEIEPTEGWITSLKVSEAGGLLAIAFCPEWEGMRFCENNIIRIYDLANERLLTEINRGHENIVFSIAFSPDNRHLATGSDDSTLRVWDIRTGKVVLEIPHPYFVISVAFSPNGTIIASGTGTVSPAESIEATIRLWNADTGELLTTLEGHKWTVSNLQFSTDGRQLASWDMNWASGVVETVLLWNLDGRSALEREFLDYAPSVGIPTPELLPFDEYVIAISDDNSLVAEINESISIISIKNSGSDDSLAVLAVSEHLAARDPYNYAATVAKFSPDSRYLVSYHRDNTTRLWSIQNSQLLLEIQNEKLVLDHFAFNTTGNILAIGGCEIDANRRCLAGIVYIINPIVAQFIGTSLPVDPFDNMSFNDNDQLILFMDDRTIIWDIGPNLLITHACMIANRNLTQDEWTNYLGGEPYSETCSDYLK